MKKGTGLSQVLCCMHVIASYNVYILVRQSSSQEFSQVSILSHIIIGLHLPKYLSALTDELQVGDIALANLHNVHKRSALIGWAHMHANYIQISNLLQ